jgi:hypothetical protein
MAKHNPGKRLAETALKQLRAIEKARLKLKAGEAAMGGFADWGVQAVWLISDLASDAIRRVEAAKAAERKKKG